MSLPEFLAETDSKESLNYLFSCIIKLGSGSGSGSGFGSGDEVK
jgi:hypothetical protein